MIFRAFKIVIDSFPDTQLLLVGDQLDGNISGLAEYRTRMESLIDELGMRKRCTCLGNRDDVELIYPACDITVLSSFYEGMPNVLLESMACGVPVVATDVCDNRYIVKDGEVGHLVTVGDEAAMAHHIESLIGDTALRQEMGRRARNWVIDEFSSKRLAENTEAVYMELLGKKHK